MPVLAAAPPSHITEPRQVQRAADLRVGRSATATIAAETAVLTATEWGSGETSIQVGVATAARSPSR